MSTQDNLNIEEISLILFLLDKENFNKYFSYIKKLNVEKETENFLKVLELYFKENDKSLVPVEEFITFFAVKRPGLRRRQIYSDFLERLDNIKISPKILEENMNNILETYYASEIIAKLTDTLDGKEYGVLDSDVKELLREFEDNKVRLSKSEEQLFVSDSLEELLQREVYRPGLKWRLSCLNQDLGDLSGQSLGHVFARVDSGKTSFLVSEVTHMASQLTGDEIILWVNNEEAGSKIKLRLYQAALKCTRDEIVSYPDDAEREFNRLGGNHIKIYDESTASVEEIRQLCLEHNVKMLIIDQGDKVKFAGSKNMSDVEMLTTLYQMFRELAKEFDIPVLTVGQADAPAEGKKWLSLNNMNRSKTGKPGELDYAIGIGKSFEDVDKGIHNIRYISLCKNKMTSGKHTRQSVRFDSERALYTDITKG